MNITISISELEYLLRQQKEITIEKLLSCTYYYNEESTDGNLKSMAINKDKFKEVGLTAKFPSDVEVLKKYLIK